MQHAVTRKWMLMMLMMLMMLIAVKLRDGALNQFGALSLLFCAVPVLANVMSFSAAEGRMQMGRASAEFMSLLARPLRTLCLSPHIRTRHDAIFLATS